MITVDASALALLTMFWMKIARIGEAHGVLLICPTATAMTSFLHRS
jgi:hypothetical protein